MTTLTKQPWNALCRIADPSTLTGLQDHERADKLQEIACTALCSAPAPAPEASVRALDWSNFEGPKRNVAWKPDEQDLIYTAINFRDDEYGDQDEDAGQQIVERLLAAWRSSVISEQLTFEISARLLKERDEARAPLAATHAPKANVEGITLSKAKIDAMHRGKLPAHKSDAYATAEAAFAEYFARNYPGPDTVIFNPAWHAPKLFYAVFRALAATPEGAADA
ncbi:hypothetical protein [Sinorhizobium meliloti]|uniref:hypothetical protein n=1 Tax=Rhizobium meliloti TaxID=382 RepID=UPI001F210C7E|nr:hypothetical protein [Sinorhizobium meliloti]